MAIDNSFIENDEKFLRQFNILCSNKEKLTTIREKTIEKIENYIKGINKYLCFVEIPNLIKLNNNSKEKFDIIQKILNISSRLKI